MYDNEKRKVAEGTISSTFPFAIRLRSENPGLARNNKANEEESSNKAKLEDSEDIQGVYIISVAARILEMHPQTLRKYERLGLVTPSRTLGMLRLYSREDIEKLRLIRHLESNLGLNLAGVEFTLELLNHLLEMHQKLTMLEEAKEFVRVVEQEMAELLRRLNLPIQEDAS
jgi:MerR family transcriptional regulator/heat shock protein HspR